VGYALTGYPPKAGSARGSGWRGHFVGEGLRTDRSGADCLPIGGCAGCALILLHGRAAEQNVAARLSQACTGTGMRSLNTRICRPRSFHASTIGTATILATVGSIAHG